MKKKISIAIVGCGRVFNHYVKIWHVIYAATQNSRILICYYTERVNVKLRTKQFVFDIIVE